MGWFKKLFGKSTPEASPANDPKPQPPSERLIPLATVDIPEDARVTAPYQDQTMRKTWAEGVVQKHGIRINPHLPVIESEAEARPRTLQQVAERLLALTFVALKGEGLDQDRLMAIITERNGMPLFTPKERDFITDPDADEHTRIQFAWRYEAAWTLFWALKFADGPLTLPNAICDVPLLVSTVRDTTDLTIHGLQPTNNLLNEADLIYRYHWAVRQAQIDGDPVPAGLEPGVVMERHYALNWLIGYDNADWDDVSTNT